jgi:hypothetical protein
VQFHDVVRSSHLNELETAALRYALSVNNEYARAALSVFRLQKDEADLAHTLRAIARRVVKEMQSGPQQQSEDQQFPVGRDCACIVPTIRLSEVLQNLLASLAENGRLTTAEVSTLLDMREAEDEVLAAAVSVYQSDNNTDELLDTLKRICKLRTVPGIVGHRVRDAEVIKDMATEVQLWVLLCRSSS